MLKLNAKYMKLHSRKHDCSSFYLDRHTKLLLRSIIKIAGSYLLFEIYMRYEERHEGFYTWGTMSGIWSRLT